LGVGCVEKEEEIHGFEEAYEHAMAVVWFSFGWSQQAGIVISKYSKQLGNICW
jgi:hypothetical protein